MRSYAVITHYICIIYLFYEKEAHHCAVKRSRFHQYIYKYIHGQSLKNISDVDISNVHFDVFSFKINFFYQLKC